jgi:hypothetical protein
MAIADRADFGQGNDAYVDVCADAAASRIDGQNPPTRIRCSRRFFAGNPAIPRSARRTGGFASPPFDGFALFNSSTLFPPLFRGHRGVRQKIRALDDGRFTGANLR